jgi:hypothetical protein
MPDRMSQYSIRFSVPAKWVHSRYFFFPPGDFLRVPPVFLPLPALDFLRLEEAFRFFFVFSGALIMNR